MALLFRCRHKGKSPVISFLTFFSCSSRENGLERLSPESAIAACKKIKFQTPEKPDSVLAFFRDHEFSKTQISDFIKKGPRFLVTVPNKSSSQSFLKTARER